MTNMKRSVPRKKVPYFTISVHCAMSPLPHARTKHFVYLFFSTAATSPLMVQSCKYIARSFKITSFADKLTPKIHPLFNSNGLDGVTHWTCPGCFIAVKLMHNNFVSPHNGAPDRKHEKALLFPYFIYLFTIYPTFSGTVPEKGTQQGAILFTCATVMPFLVISVVHPFSQWRRGRMSASRARSARNTGYGSSICHFTASSPTSLISPSALVRCEIAHHSHTIQLWHFQYENKNERFIIFFN